MSQGSLHNNTQSYADCMPAAICSLSVSASFSIEIGAMHLSQVAHSLKQTRHKACACNVKQSRPAVVRAHGSMAQAVSGMPPNYEVLVAGVVLSTIVHHLYMPLQVGLARKKCVTSFICSCVGLLDC